LLNTDTLALIEYIKTSVEILLNLKMDTSAVSGHSNHHNHHRGRGGNHNGNGGGADGSRVRTDNSALESSQITTSSNFT
jgi:hypothetical protein